MRRLGERAQGQARPGDDDHAEQRFVRQPDVQDLFRSVRQGEDHVEADQVPVVLRGEDYDFDGRGLVIRWNERDRRLQLLEIAHGEKLIDQAPELVHEEGRGAGGYAPGNRVMGMMGGWGDGHAPLPVMLAAKNEGRRRRGAVAAAAARRPGRRDATRLEGRRAEAEDHAEHGSAAVPGDLP